MGYKRINERGNEARTKGDKMKATATKIDLGNNESIGRGICRNADGTFTAMTFTKSKTFKTIRGAQKWMERKVA